jgi:hypothetical protein
MINPTLQWTTIECIKCHKESRFICGGCGLVAYCDKKCQREDIKTHCGEQCDALAKYLVAMIMENLGISDADFMIGMKRRMPGDTDKKKKKTKSNVVQEAHATALKKLSGDYAAHVQSLQKEWMKPGVTNRAKLSFLMGMHRRTGAKSPLRFVSPDVISHIINFLQTPSLKIWRTDGSDITITNAIKFDGILHQETATTTTTTTSTTDAKPSLKLKLPGNDLKIVAMPFENTIMYATEENQNRVAIKLTDGDDPSTWSQSMRVNDDGTRPLIAVSEQNAVISNKYGRADGSVFISGNKIHNITGGSGLMNQIGRAGKTATEYAKRSGHTSDDVFLLTENLIGGNVCYVLVERNGRVELLEFARFQNHPRRDGENACSMSNQHRLHTYIPEVSVRLPGGKNPLRCILNNDPDVGFVKKQHSEEIVDGIAFSTCWMKKGAYSMYVCVLPTTTESETATVTVIDTKGKLTTTTASSVVNQKSETISLMMHPFFSGFHDPATKKKIHKFELLNMGGNTFISFWKLNKKDPEFERELARMKIPIKSSEDFVLHHIVCVTRHDKDLVVRCSIFAMPRVISTLSGMLTLDDAIGEVLAYDGDDTIVIENSGKLTGIVTNYSTLWKVTLSTGKSEFLDHLIYSPDSKTKWGVVLSTSL